MSGINEQINPKDHNIIKPVKDCDKDGSEDNSVTKELSEDVNDNRGK